MIKENAEVVVESSKKFGSQCIVVAIDAKKIRKNIPFAISYNLRNAIQAIFYDIEKHKNQKCTILLSPAAASFDQFKNFEDRGYYFNNLIKKIKFIKKINDQSK